MMSSALDRQPMERSVPEHVMGSIGSTAISGQGRQSLARASRCRAARCPKPVATKKKGTTDFQDGSYEGPGQEAHSKKPCEALRRNGFLLSLEMAIRCLLPPRLGSLKSIDSGQSWTSRCGSRRGTSGMRLLRRSRTVFAASLSKAALTNDGGKTWTSVTPPSDLTQITAVAVDGFGGLWIGGREGVYLSEDKGATWQTVQNLFMRDVNSIFYDEQGRACTGDGQQLDDACVCSSSSGQEGEVLEHRLESASHASGWRSSRWSDVVRWHCDSAGDGEFG